MVQLESVTACMFDAYGTLFDVNAAAAGCRDELGDDWEPLAMAWRSRQLQYTWLRSLMDRYVDFWQVTGDALDFALAAVGRTNPDLRARLLELYLTLDPYPDARDALDALADAGVAKAILSNGSPHMLDAATRHSGLTDSFDAVLSADAVQIFKPHPTVYRLGVDRFGGPPHNLVFVSANAWDVAGAAEFGYRAVWLNRAGQPAERLPGGAAAEIEHLGQLTGLFA